jgi:arsenate reductase
MIYHNPRCSKSREALGLVQQFAEEEDIPLEIIEYLKTPPTRAQLRTLQQLLGGDLQAIIRNNEDEYETLGLASADEAALLDALATYPKLLQRPLIVYRDRALIARPPELLRDFLARA